MGVWKGAWKSARAMWSSHGAYQRAIGLLIGVNVPGKIAAGVEPVHRNEKMAKLTGGLAHDVSTLLGVGRHLGSQPRAKASITIMRAPHRGHGQGGTRGASGVASGGFRESAVGGATASNARGVAMLSARLALAKSP